MVKRKLNIEFDTHDIELGDFTPVTVSDEKTGTTQYTLLKAIEEIVIALKDSNMDSDELESCKDAVEHLKARCHFNNWQAIMFALCVNQSLDPKITIADLRRWIGCPMICMLSHEEELDKLVEMGALIEGEPDETTTYAVPKYVMDGLKKDEFVTHIESTNLEFPDFFERMGEIFNRRFCGMTFKQAKSYIDSLIKENSHLTYCKYILSYKDMKADDIMLIHFISHRAINHDDFYITESDVSGVLERRCEVAATFRKLRAGTHPLIKMNLLENMNNDGIRIPATFTLTSHARTTLLVEAELEAEEMQTITCRELVAADKIKPKDMFYTSRVESEVSRLAALVEPKQFKAICDRLSAYGMRRGFACLFYGAPGTGKTETALQLARMTGRDIMQVNVSDIRSKWVGESEKAVKSLFDRYRKAAKESKVTPILLFNEADALLTRRNDSSVSSVDKMENAMQNIFLQEIENLEGILIATTNLTTNLDAAFERRFLYKVNFEKPDMECRGKLWKSMVKDIDESVASQLAARYDFSGGQIENIARKHIVDTILYGASKQPLASLTTYCENELISNKKTRKIGFAS